VLGFGVFLVVVVPTDAAAAETRDSLLCTSLACVIRGCFRSTKRNSSKHH